MLGLELQVTALVVDGDASAGDDLHAVLRAETQQPRLRPPHHHAQLRRAVLQREVEVAGFGGAIVGDFALDVNVGEGALHLRAHGRDQFAHGINLARWSLEHEPELFRAGLEKVYQGKPSALSCQLSAKPEYQKIMSKGR